LPPTRIILPVRVAHQSLTSDDPVLLSGARRAVLGPLAQFFRRRPNSDHIRPARWIGKIVITPSASSLTC